MIAACTHQIAWRFSFYDSLRTHLHIWQPLARGCPKSTPGTALKRNCVSMLSPQLASFRSAITGRRSRSPDSCGHPAHLVDRTSAHADRVDCVAHLGRTPPPRGRLVDCRSDCLARHTQAGSPTSDVAANLPLGGSPALPTAPHRPAATRP